MYLTIREAAEYLGGVSEKWLHDRLAAGDSELSTHLKLRRDRKEGTVASSRDRNRTLISVGVLARYVLLNTRPHRRAPFPETVPSEAMARKRQEILAWLDWHRGCAPRLPGDVLHQALEEADVPAETIDSVIHRLREHPAVSAGFHGSAAAWRSKASTSSATRQKSYKRC